MLDVASFSGVFMKQLVAVLLIYLSSVGISIACSQTITVVPGRILTDETTTIRVTELKSGEHVVVRGELVDGDGKTWIRRLSLLPMNTG